MLTLAWVVNQCLPCIITGRLTARSLIKAAAQAWKCASVVAQTLAAEQRKLQQRTVPLLRLLPGKGPANSSKILLQSFSGGGRMAKNLRVALLAEGCSQESLPTNTQLSKWPKQFHRKQKFIERRSKDCCCSWPRSCFSPPLPSAAGRFDVLVNEFTSNSEICVIFACPGC